MVDRITTLDKGYLTGDLSIYPTARDDANQLYQVRNNAQTVLTQSITYNSQFFVVNDASAFPPQGILAVGTELVYYDSRTDTIFSNLKRGFAGSRQNVWDTGTVVSNSVSAEIHNAVKDATYNIEHNLGLEDNPDVNSLNGILKALETRFLAPKPILRATPIKGAPPLTVAFQNFSSGPAIRFLWDFGDGGTSVEQAPVHTYVAEGTYTVTLKMMTSLGAQGIVTKTDYITVSNAEVPAFFYVTPMFGNTSTAFSFVDQTEGAVNSRYWVFDDGLTDTELDPSSHVTSHTYSTPGLYNPTLIVVFDDQTIKRLSLDEPIVVN